MVHPIVSVLVTRPDLVADHVAGYAAMMQEQASVLGAELAWRAVAWCIVLTGLLVFLITAGVALMLGVMHGQFHWVLLAVPGAPLLLSLLAWGMVRQRPPMTAFAELKAQFDADALALHTLGAHT